MANNVTYIIVEKPNDVHIKDLEGNEYGVGSEIRLDAVKIEYVVSPSETKDYFYIQIDDPLATVNYPCQIEFSGGIGTLQWSNNNNVLTGWNTAYTTGGTIPITGLTNGSKIYFKGTMDFTEGDPDDPDRGVGCGRFKVVNTNNPQNKIKFKIGGHIISISKDNFDAPAPKNAFSCLFKETNVENFSDLIFPSTLGNYACAYMFDGCKSLETTAGLSSNVIGDYCYYYMFSECTLLETPPSISFSTMGEYACASMFNKCTSLRSIPTLSATGLTEGCYQYMFSECTSLTNLSDSNQPKLQASVLKPSCYEGMFENCTGLTNPPSLWRALTASDYCCLGMFSGCTNLIRVSEIRVNNLDRQVEACFESMFEGCVSLRDSKFDDDSTLTLSLSNLSNSSRIYRRMFYGCTNLETPPIICATTMGTYCCDEMFGDCEGLIYLPDFLKNRLTLGVGCFKHMFVGCSSLVGYEDQSSDLTLSSQNDELKSECYFGMFRMCSSLSSTLEITQKTSAYRACRDMFLGCTNIEEAVVDIKTFNNNDNECCYNMFSGCTGLVSLTFKATHVYASGVLKDIKEADTTDHYIITALKNYINTGCTTGVAENGNKESGVVINRYIKGVDCCYAQRIKSVLGGYAGNIMYVKHKNGDITFNCKGWWVRSVEDTYCHGYQTILYVDGKYYYTSSEYGGNCNCNGSGDYIHECYMYDNGHNCENCIPWSDSGLSC